MKKLGAGRDFRARKRPKAATMVGHAQKPVRVSWSKEEKHARLRKQVDRSGEDPELGENTK